MISDLMLHEVIQESSSAKNCNDARPNSVLQLYQLLLAFFRVSLYVLRDLRVKIGAMLKTDGLKRKLSHEIGIGIVHYHYKCQALYRNPFYSFQTCSCVIEIFSITSSKISVEIAQDYITYTDCIIIA